MATLDYLVAFRQTFAYQLIFIFILFVLFVIIGGLIAFFVIRWLIYNKKIVIVEKVNGIYEFSRRDKARAIRFPETGTVIIYLKKLKKYQAFPTKRVGRNTYMFYLKNGQTLVNVGIEDLDQKTKELKLKLPDTEMSLSRDGLQKIFKDRFQKISWLAKYGVVLGAVVFIVVFGIMVYLGMDKFIEFVDRLGGLTGQLEAVAARIEQMMASADNICQGGSGFVEV